MFFKRAVAIVALLGLGMAACRETPVEPADKNAPNFAQVGEPCDPATYTGPGRCVEDPNSESGYAIAE